MIGFRIMNDRADHLLNAGTADLLPFNLPNERPCLLNGFTAGNAQFFYISNLHNRLLSTE